MGIGNWELGTGKQLFSGHPSKSLHCFIYPNAQCPITNDQLPKQPFLIELYTRVDYRKLYMRLHYFFPSFFFLSYNKSHTQHTINFLRINLLKLSFVPDVFRILVFIDPFFNQISSVQSPSFFIRVFRICLILRHEFPAASSEYNLDAISIRILNKL